MNRRHAEHAFASQLERGDLDHHRQGFHHKHATHDEQHNFLTYDHRDGAQRGAQRQRADIAHKHLRRVGVEPQKTKARADQRGAEHNQLTGARHIRNKQIFGELNVARQVAENPQCTANHHRRHNRQTVEAVSQVHRIARADNHQVAEHYETNAQASTQRNADVFEHWHDQGGFYRALRADEQK